MNSRSTTSCRSSAPHPKPLTLSRPPARPFANLTKRLLRALDGVQPVNDAASADLAIVRYDPLDPVLPAGNAVIFVNDETRGGQYLAAASSPTATRSSTA